ncbi:MAG: universal stress protein [Kofleriaceae bacterium]
MSATPIAHTTDATGDDAAAFLHGAALAAASGLPLVTVHGEAAATAPHRLPDGATLATRWQRPIDHQLRCHACCDDITDNVLDALRHLGPRMVVVGTHARHGLGARLRGSVGEAIARGCGVPTLVVPNEGRGFVDVATGAIDLRRIVVPAQDAASAHVAVAAARGLATLAGTPDVAIELLHAGDRDEPSLLALGLPVVRRAGSLTEVVRDRVAEVDARLVVMATHGHDGPIDVVLGSHTERVLRDVAGPLLSVPWREPTT